MIDGKGRPIGIADGPSALGMLHEDAGSHERGTELRTQTRSLAQKRMDATTRNRNIREMRGRNPGPASLIPDNDPDLRYDTMRVGDEVQAVLRFEDHAVHGSEEAARIFSGRSPHHGAVVVLRRCRIDTPSGDVFHTDASVYVGGELAERLAKHPQSLERRSFLLHGRLRRRSSAPSDYDLTAFAGTSPREP